MTVNVAELNAAATRAVTRGVANASEGSEWLVYLAPVLVGYRLTVSAVFAGVRRRGYTLVLSDSEIAVLGADIVAKRAAQLADRLIRNAERRRV